MSFLEGDSGQGPEVNDGGQPAGDPGNQPEPEVRLSPYAQNFLEQVPEEERGVVSKYLPKWDGGFTQYAQRVQGELKRYKDLGDPETLQTAHGLYQKFTTDPQGVAEYLYGLGYTPQQAAAAAQQVAQNQQGQNEDPYAPKFKEFETKYERLERALGLMVENQRKQQEAAEQAMYDKQLDELVAGIKSQDKTIPEEFILTMVHAGVQPEMIPGRWRQVVQSHISRERNGQPSSAPNLMGSGTNGPVQQNPANMSEDQRREAFLRHVEQAFGA